MALYNNFIPQTSLIFTPRDYAQQIMQNQADDTRAVQNAGKFLGNVIDIAKNRQIANEMQKEEPDYKKIDSIAASRILSPDTSFSNWRWKKMLDAQDATNKRDKANNLANVQFEIANTLATIKPTPSMDSGMKQSYLNKLADLRTMAQKNGLATDDIDATIALVNNDGIPVAPAASNNSTPSPSPAAEPAAEVDPYSGTEYTGTPIERDEAALASLINKKGVTLQELVTFKNSKPTLSNAKKNELDSKIAEIQARDKRIAEAKKRENDIIKKGMNITSEDIEFMKGRKGIKLVTDSFGNEWFERE